MIAYVHIPFCHRICPYCSFYKHTPGDTDLRAFIKAILQEATTCSERGDIHEPIETLYLGGGTPSMLSPGHLSELFDGLHQILPLDDTHITLEANPATFGNSKAELFKSLGVNRVSLGIQSLTPHVLETLGREHNPEQAAEAVNILKKANLDEINIDLMFAIPGQSLTDWQSTLETAISLKPDHISAYNLTYEEDTDFIERLTQGQYSESEDTNADMFTMADELLTKAGFLHYETSNYAQPGKESKHNRGYWKGSDYLGLGPSAVSTIRGSRWRNLPDTAGYIHAINTVQHAKREEEVIDTEAYRIERIALLLRTQDGLPTEYLENSPDGAVDEILSNHLAEVQNGKLKLRGDGIMLVDSLAEKLV